MSEGRTTAPTPPPPPSSAFPATMRAVRAHMGEAVLDAASFARPLARCDLAHCRGTCCAEGVYLNPELALVVANVVRRHAPFLAAAGLDVAAPLVVHEPPDDPDDPDEEPVARTALRAAPFHALVADYPHHFPDTACAFLTPDARCGLQLVAEHEGRHPWHYKPLACWLHPISLAPDVVRLHDAVSDPYPGGFTSATHCGRTAPAGRPAAEVLAAELAYLSWVLDRDLSAGLAADAPGDPAVGP